MNLSDISNSITVSPPQNRLGIETGYRVGPNGYIGYILVHVQAHIEKQDITDLLQAHTRILDAIVTEANRPENTTLVFLVDLGGSTLMALPDATTGTGREVVSQAQAHGITIGGEFVVVSVPEAVAPFLRIAGVLIKPFSPNFQIFRNFQTAQGEAEKIVGLSEQPPTPLAM